MWSDNAAYKFQTQNVFHCTRASLETKCKNKKITSSDCWKFD